MEPYRIRPVLPGGDAQVAWIIRAVPTERGGDGPGFPIHDPEGGRRSETHGHPGSACLVVGKEGQVLGGGGIAPLVGGPAGVCELRKMCYLPVLRGKGLGEGLRETCLDAALRLCGRMGISRRRRPLGDTGHPTCDGWYAKELA